MSRQEQRLQMMRKHRTEELRFSIDDIQIFENQRKAAHRVCSYFDKPETLYAMIIAYCQSGKTGTLLAIIEEFACNRQTVPVDNIFILTGLSDNEWKKQNKSFFPDELQEKIYHRNELKTKFVNDFNKSIQNGGEILILLDELHVASSEDMTVDTVFKQLNLSTPEFCREKKIKQIEVSATPEGVLSDREETGERFVKVIADPGSGYVGVKELHNTNRFRDVKDFSDKEEVNNFMWDILTNFNENPKYHIVRLPKKNPKMTLTRYNFENEIRNMRDTFNDTIMEFSLNGNIDDIKLIDTKPNKHTIIFLKDMIGCAKNIQNKEHIGFWACRWNDGKGCDTAMIQDIGRMCGYNIPTHVRVYCKLSVVKKYLKWDDDLRNGRPCDIIWDGGHKKGTTRGKDKESGLNFERKKHIKIPVEFFKYKCFSLDEHDKAMAYIDETFNKMKKVFKFRKNDKNDKKALQKTKNEIIEEQYQISTGRWHRLSKCKDGYVVYWDARHEDAPKNA